MPDLDIPRLIKVLGMLGSNHDGEKLAALARASGCRRRNTVARLAFALRYEDE